MQPNITKKKRSWYRRILLAVVIAAVLWFIWQNLSEIKLYNFRVRWSYVFAAFLVTLANYIMNFFIWVWLTSSFGLKVPLLKAARGWFLSYLGKYIPGKVALLLVRLDAYSGFSKKVVALATIVEYIVALAAACLVIIFSVMISPEIVPVYMRWASLICAIILLAILYPPLLKGLANWALRLFRREPIDDFPSFKKILLFVMAYMVTSLVSGLVIFLVLNALTPVSFKYFLAITGIYNIAGLVGLAALFAPGGIGVREGMLFLLLPLFIPKPAVIVGAIVTRLLLILVELLLAGIFVSAEKVCRK